MSEHDEGQHALLSPSSAHRWSTCPASVRLCLTLPTPPSSTYADEGTAFHALAELYARMLLLGDFTGEEFAAAIDGWRDEHSAAIRDEHEMKRHAIEYVEYLRDLLADNPGAQLFLEQRLPTGVPQSWGTSDAVIVSTSVVIVVDVKYGAGIRVDAAGNEQLRLYAVGALEAFGDLLGEVKDVTYGVWQPRLDHIDSETISAVDLRSWRDSLIPIAESALGDDAPFGPSEDACRFCPASGNCAAQVAFFTELDFGTTPETLSAEDLAELLPRLDGIEAWCAAVRTSAFTRASSGELIPGYKLVRSNGKRYVADEEGLIEALDMLGFERKLYTKTSVVGIGDLTKLGVIDTVAPFIQKSEGKPGLAPESDRRPAIDTSTEAAADFADDLD